VSPRRVGVLPKKEIVHGSKSFFFIFAVLAPIILSVVLSLVFGTLFSEKPELGITDEGNSQLVSLAAKQDAVVVKSYASTSELKQAVRAGAEVA
jgi:ABC-2 type transport system permease protein